MEETDWSEAKKFRFQTIRTVALAVFGTIAVLVVVKPVENYIDYLAEIESTRLAISATVVDEFLSVSHKYTSVAYDVCNGEERFRDSLENELVDEFRSAQQRLELYFRDEDQVLESGVTVNDHAEVFWTDCELGPSGKEKWEGSREKLKAANRELGRTALAVLGL